jgi:hypothetical protein
MPLALEREGVVAATYEKTVGLQPLSPTLSPLLRRGEREKMALPLLLSCQGLLRLLHFGGIF